MEDYWRILFTSLDGAREYLIREDGTVRICTNPHTNTWELATKEQVAEALQLFRENKKSSCVFLTNHCTCIGIE